MLLAEEGINGTIAGTREGIDAVRAWLDLDGRFGRLEYKESLMDADSVPFYRMKVKLKKEIVTLGLPGISPKMKVGRYVMPEDWNELIKTQKLYHGRHAQQLQNMRSVHLAQSTRKPRHFVSFRNGASQNLDPKKHKKVAMFCTGGIRCEKSTSYLLEKALKRFITLKAECLELLDRVPHTESIWEGECFVFDNRVTVNHQLKLAVGEFDQCSCVCRRPITKADKTRSEFVMGVQCHHCIDEYSDAQRERFLMRQQQIELAESRGERHVGIDVQAFEKRQMDARRERHLKRVTSSSGLTVIWSE